jgi:hypothetical protein
MALPGKKKKPEKKKKPGKKAEESSKPEDTGYDELGFSDMEKQAAELKQIRESHAREQIEKIKKQRLKETPKKKKEGQGDTRLDVTELQTETEARKGGMPEHIAALPDGHPIKVRWEKGFRQRQDGTWYQLSEDELKGNISGMSEGQQRAFFIIPLLVIGIFLVIGSNWYVNELSDTRKQIFKTIRQKELPKDEPDIKRKLQRARTSHWLPELTTLLDEFKEAKSKFTSLSDNKEKGSYIQHIKKHNKKFDADEAMQWRTKSIRKPSQ